LKIASAILPAREYHLLQEFTAGPIIAAREADIPCLLPTGSINNAGL